MAITPLALWDRKRQVIEQTPLLFRDIAGV
jgi:hypothetical protein